ncbi:hypothetical protein EVA_09448 [gut metagenome]|uniref:Uncharacterized protein n=1 Tax=gut metagenome TaxID=749906 RepID=J9G5E4_9ZZZZ
MYKCFILLAKVVKLKHTHVLPVRQLFGGCAESFSLPSCVGYGQEPRQPTFAQPSPRVKSPSYLLNQIS